MHPFPSTATPMPSRLFVACVLALGAACAAQAKTIRVPADSPTIQAAITAAETGDSVLVAPGYYDERLVIHNKGISLIGEAGAEQTLIDGAFNGTIVTFDASEPFESRIAGFTLVSGKAPGLEGGGGIKVSGHASVTIERNGIFNNWASFGSGILVQDFATVQVRHNHISYNTGEGVTLTSVPDGLTSISQNVIEFNESGGIVIQDVGGNGGTTITANIIRFNNSGFDGGGVRLASSSSELPTFVNNLIYRNRTTANGGGIHVVAPAGAAGTFTNNTIADNKAAIATELYYAAQGAARVRFDNNILRSSSKNGAVYCSGDSPQFNFNDVFGARGNVVSGTCVGTADSGTNVSKDPMFVSMRGHDAYRLGSGSPLIDAGDNSAVVRVKHDRLLQPRIADGGRGPIVDLGAYELQPN